jgi:hypothetical protein
VICVLVIKNEALTNLKVSSVTVHGQIELGDCAVCAGGFLAAPVHLLSVSGWGSKAVKKQSGRAGTSGTPVPENLESQAGLLPISS